MSEGRSPNAAHRSRPGRGTPCRLLQQLADSVARSNRAVSDVGAEYGVGWHTTHKALISAAARWLPEPTPTMVPGIDETRARWVRWLREETGWRRSDPWMTSFVDADPTGPGGLLGLVPGRSGACVRTWLNEQTQLFRDTIEVVVIDPSAPYASGIRRALPNAKIAVDHWHLVRLVNEMVTDVRQRVAVNNSAAAAAKPTRPGRTDGCC